MHKLISNEFTSASAYIQCECHLFLSFYWLTLTVQKGVLVVMTLYSIMLITELAINLIQHRLEQDTECQKRTILLIQIITQHLGYCLHTHIFSCSRDSCMNIGVGSHRGPESV